MQQNIVVDFSMKNGRENRNNGNQEKGKEENKEALRSQYEVNRGRQKRPLSFLAVEFCMRSRSIQRIPGILRNIHGNIWSPFFAGWA